MTNISTQPVSTQHPVIPSQAATMSSREIADLLGKRHYHVTADIEKMLKDLGEDATNFRAIYRDSLNREQSEYRLDRFHAEVLVTGYDTKRRAAVLKRLADLEAGVALPAQNPTTQRELVEGAGAFLDALNIQGSARATSMRAFAASNCPQYLPLIPNYTIDAPVVAGQEPSSLPTSSATDLLRSCNTGVSASYFNKVCHSQGLLEKLSRTNSKGEEVSFWSVTRVGLEYGKNVTSPQSPRQTQPHWYVERFDDLLAVIGLEHAA